MKYKTAFKDGLHSLTVSSVNLTDAGMYTCQAFDENGTSLSSCILNVLNDVVS